MFPENHPPFVSLSKVEKGYLLQPEDQSYLLGQVEQELVTGEKNLYDLSGDFGLVARLFSSLVSIADWCNVHLDLLAVLTAQVRRLCDLRDTVDVVLLSTNVRGRAATDDWD